jgi:hypothetical protein
MKHTPKHMVAQAIKVINGYYEYPLVKLADWTDVASGYAILLDDELGEYNAIDISDNATIHGALPRGTFLEPINSYSLRLVRA